MSKLSDVIDMRLKELGIKGSKMCDDLGISRSTLTELRKGRATTLKADRAAAIANYLGVTVDYLLGNVSEPFLFKDEKGILHIDDDAFMEIKKAPTPEGERESKKEELMAAFWGGEKDLSPEDLEAMWADVENFAAFVAEKKRREKQK